MTHPLVSVVTATWQRHDLLLETIENVRSQTYRPLEHVIVSDGPDPELRQRLHDAHGVGSFHDVDTDVPIQFVECGRNWSTFLAASFAAIPFQVAQWLASGDYLMWMTDDEEMIAPDHIEALVNLLESGPYDFVYPRVELWSEVDPTFRRVIGTDPPEVGQLTHVLYRADLLDYRGFTQHVGYGSDWDQVKHWMHFGASWAMLDRVTFRHRADHFEPGLEYRETRRRMVQQRSAVAP